MATNTTKINELIYPELSYKIVGILYKVHKGIGEGYREKHVQKAVATVLEKENIKFGREVEAVMEFDGKTIGRYFLDFVIDDKIVIELKVCSRPLKKDFDQIKHYLGKTGLILGLLACFSNNGVKIYRVLKPSNHVY